jgi:hypothetical protein
MLQKLNEQSSCLPPDAGGVVSYSSLTHLRMPDITNNDRLNTPGTCKLRRINFGAALFGPAYCIDCERP